MEPLLELAFTLAVALFMAIVFRVGAKLWRWSSKRGAVNDTEGGPVDDSNPDAEGASVDDSNPRVDHDVPAIFLSHSGKQKYFVENLYDALRRTNHVAFFDKHSLPKGSPFPAHIERAAIGCKLGVVVLSDDFLSSKWPMLELEMFLTKRGPDAKVLPLFYKLSPQDLKSPKNLSKWRQTWKKKAPKHVNQWERAVELLDSFNGVEFTPGTSEATYINKVVSVICNLVPSSVLYDLPSIKGQQRLAEVVAGQFEKAAGQCDTVCMVGLHGVGGLGKTTMCKIMVNFFNAQYPGKCCHIEFPNDGDDKKIVQECKKALKTLGNLSDEHLLNKVDDFDQIVQLMKENLRQYDVFLAIDNVWESSGEKAKRILGVGFSANSKILVTSRSEQVLKDLPSCHEYKIRPLPCPDHEEALQIFQETFSQDGDLNSFVNRSQLDSVLKSCFFSGSYHALALKALSQHVKRVCEIEGLHGLPHILEEISIRDLQSVEDVLLLNYKNLPEHKQHMFLDIVITQATLFGGDTREYAKAHWWLSVLYNKYSASKITTLIGELAVDGLIQLEKVGRSKMMMITVHDLYFDLAQRKAANSSRFYTNGSTRSVEKIEWERLERVILIGGDSARFVEKLQQQECEKLQVLYGGSVHFQSGIDINRMPSLCILKLQKGTLGSIKNWSAATGLAIVHLEDLGGLSCVEDLITPALKEVRIEGCRALKKVPHHRGLPGLERLELNDNELMDEVEGLISPALKEVRIQVCWALKKVPDLSGLTSLEMLFLDFNNSLEEVGGENLSCTLKELRVLDCTRLRRFPSLDECVHLHSLGVSPQFFEMVSFKPEKMASLHHLWLWDGEWTSRTERVISGLTRLQVLCIERCEKLVKLDVGCFPASHVNTLRVESCLELEEIGAPDSLRLLRVERCGKLKRIGGECLNLQQLELYVCESLEEASIPDVSLIPCVTISHCAKLNDFEKGRMLSHEDDGRFFRSFTLSKAAMHRALLLKVVHEEVDGLFYGRQPRDFAYLNSSLST